MAPSHTQLSGAVLLVLSGAEQNEGMALIKCYECEKEISDKAPACPHCGAPKGGKKDEDLLRER